LAVWAIIAAAGKSRRMAGKHKLLIQLRGKPVIWWVLKPFEKCREIEGIVLVAPQELQDKFKQIIDKAGFEKVTHIIPGGENRQASVYNGLTALPENVDHIIIHDGARPFLSSYLLDKIITIGKKRDAATLAIPVYDSLKRIKSGKVVENMPREGIWVAQTPQIFKKELLLKAYDKAFQDNFTGTDEVSLVSRLPYPVQIILGSVENLKLTSPQDLAAADLLIRAQQQEAIVGT